MLSESEVREYQQKWSQEDSDRVPERAIRAILTLAETCLHHMAENHWRQENCGTCKAQIHMEDTQSHIRECKYTLERAPDYHLACDKWRPKEEQGDAK